MNFPWLLIIVHRGSCLGSLLCFGGITSLGPWGLAYTSECPGYCMRPQEDSVSPTCFPFPVCCPTKTSQTSDLFLLHLEGNHKFLSLWVTTLSKAKPWQATSSPPGPKLTLRTAIAYLLLLPKCTHLPPSSIPPSLSRAWSPVCSPAVLPFCPPLAQSNPSQRQPSPCSFCLHLPPISPSTPALAHLLLPKSCDICGW